MAFRRDRVKPTHYPRLPFHLVRTAQLLSSIVVASVMFYFISELARDHFRLPWTFILVSLLPDVLVVPGISYLLLQLIGVALLTLVSLTLTIVLHCFYGLNPMLNTLLNTCLALLWAVAFSLLSWWSSGTLSHVCNRDNWDDELGVSVCRLYKALFSFSLLGLLSTLVALVLDVHVQRQAVVRGRFQAIGMVGSDVKSGRTARHESQPSEIGRDRQQRHGNEGYALPEEQFAYGEDMGYHGAAGQVGRRSLEERL
jgi:hypothetical protein